MTLLIFVLVSLNAQLINKMIPYYYINVCHLLTMLKMSISKYFIINKISSFLTYSINLLYNISIYFLLLFIKKNGTFPLGLFDTKMN